MEAFMTHEEELRIARESSFRDGKEETELRFERLASALREAGRGDELMPAMRDRGVRDALMAEFHIA